MPSPVQTLQNRKLNLKLINALKGYSRKKITHICKAFSSLGKQPQTVPRCFMVKASRARHGVSLTLWVFIQLREENPGKKTKVSASHKPSTLILSQPPSVSSHPSLLPAPLFYDPLLLWTIRSHTLLSSHHLSRAQSGAAQPECMRSEA